MPRLAGLFVIALLAAHSLARGLAATSPWAEPGSDGRLRYQADARGNTIPDFSRAGYGGGGVARCCCGGASIAPPAR